MHVNLSSRGRVVIPKQIREELRLEPGTQFEVRIDEHRHIVLTPVRSKEEIMAATARLAGMFAGSDLLTALEEEHRWEIERDEARIRAFGSGNLGDHSSDQG
jgi:AbrB family looped-hinge helix DNA binding protein